MSLNSNLFYDLYSKSNNATNPGYACRSAVDELDTSFDISNTNGVITDSNGKDLATIDMSKIHAEGLTQYNTETRILQPHSCYLLQGQEYGLSCATYYYIIPEEIQATENYEKYVESDFDIIYNNFCPLYAHISTKVDGENSFVDLINDDLENAGIDVRVSILQIKCEKCGKMIDYLVFLSQKEGYFFIITNNKITPVFQSEDYPYSPFSRELSGMKNIIYDFIEQFHPVQKDEIYDEATYKVNCELYTWFLYNYYDAIQTLDNFSSALGIFKKIYTETHTPEEIEDMIEEINLLLKNTPYDLPIIAKYDYKNLCIIKNIVESIKAMLIETYKYYQEIYWLKEDISKRIPIMKYPNGAFRGIVVIPDWPTNNSELYETASLMIHHIPDAVTLYKPVPDGHFIPKKYGILSNALIKDEQINLKKCDKNFGSLDCNYNFVNNIPNGWNDILDIEITDSRHPDYLHIEENSYMGQSCYASKRNVIGLCRYIMHVFENDLWTKTGLAYMIVGNKDNVLTHVKNLPNSLIIYNPNNVPIRIKYMIFS